MTTPDALLAAVIANPDDDTPRLVYADWLEEHGGEADRARAEFIRVQCEIERLLPQDDPRLDGLIAREAELWEPHKKVWDASLRDWFINREYDRGFIEDVTVFENRFLRHTGEIFRAAPFRKLEITGTPIGEGDEPFQIDWARKLAAEPMAARLTALRMPDMGLQEEEIEVLARSRFLRGLVELDLSNNIDFGAAVLFGRGRLPGLQRVNLSALGLDDDWITDLTECPAARLKRLRELDLSANLLTGDGAMTLVECPHLRLEKIHLAGNDIDGDALDRLRERFGADAVSLEPREN